MLINSLQLSEFKNYTKGNFEFNHRFNLITGRNGIGKTNLLDAIYFLSFCKSYFINQDKNLVKHDESYFRIEGKFLDKLGKDYKIVAKYSPSTGKTIECDNVAYSKFSDHIGMVPLIIIAPWDLQSIVSGSLERRKLMDIGVSQFNREFLEASMTYNRILKQRNAYLKSVQDRTRIDEKLLLSYDELMMAPASTIYSQRKAFVSELNPIFGSIYKDISSSHESVTCALKSELDTLPFLEIQWRNRKKDVILHRTSGGIHRDDLILMMDGQDIQTFGSQGQLKSCILALKLATFFIIEKHRLQDPILLLDDIFDKLDNNRVFNLLSYLSKNTQSQIFITDTNADRLITIMKELSEDYLSLKVE